MRRKAAGVVAARRWFLTLGLALTLVVGGSPSSSPVERIVGPVRQLTETTSESRPAISTRLRPVGRRNRRAGRDSTGWPSGSVSCAGPISASARRPADDRSRDRVALRSRHRDRHRRTCEANQRRRRNLFGARAEALGRPIEEVARDPRLEGGAGVLGRSGRRSGERRRGTAVVDGAARLPRANDPDAGCRHWSAPSPCSKTDAPARDRPAESEFIAAASHELRTPLTSVQMGMHLLLEGSAGELSATQRELLAMCRDDTLRLDKLVNDLLELARIESGEGVPPARANPCARAAHRRRGTAAAPDRGERPHPAGRRSFRDCRRSPRIAGRSSG